MSIDYDRREREWDREHDHGICTVQSSPEGEEELRRRESEAKKEEEERKEEEKRKED